MLPRTPVLFSVLFACLAPPLLAQAETYLRPGGALIVEVGNSAPALEQAFPRTPFTWLEFSDGDSGVFFVTREELFKSCQPAG